LKISSNIFNTSEISDSGSVYASVNTSKRLLNIIMNKIKLVNYWSSFNLLHCILIYDSLSNIKKLDFFILFHICIVIEISSALILFPFDNVLLVGSVYSVFMFNTFTDWFGISSIISYISLFFLWISSFANSNKFFLCLLFLSNCS